MKSLKKKKSLEAIKAVGCLPGLGCRGVAVEVVSGEMGDEELSTRGPLSIVMGTPGGGAPASGSWGEERKI